MRPVSATITKDNIGVLKNIIVMAIDNLKAVTNEYTDLKDASLGGITNLRIVITGPGVPDIYMLRKDSEIEKAIKEIMECYLKRGKSLEVYYGGFPNMIFARQRSNI